MICRFKILFLPFVFLAVEASGQSGISRKELLNVQLSEQKISLVKADEITFKPGQKAPFHRHPCPVAGFIVEGTCLLQVEGKAPRILKTGDAFFEPAGTPILHFDNNSDSLPLKFIAYYLTNKEEALTEFLPAKK